MNISTKEKIYGMLFGYAIGDAFGLGTEFMTKTEVKLRYPKGLTDYSQFVNDAHRSHFRRGDWSLDTDSLLLITDHLADTGKLDAFGIAKHLQNWYHNNPNTDIPSCMHWVFRDEEYASDPIGVARRAWDGTGRFEASNEALGRALIAGIWNENPVNDAVDLTCITHADARCSSCGAIISLMARDLLYNDRMTDMEELAAEARRIDDRVLPYLRAARYGKISDFELDDEDTLWYVRKAMGSALWGLWNCSTPIEILMTIVHEGGDADTNASLALALAGLRYGFSSLPQKEIDGLLQKERLEKSAERLYNLIKERVGKD